MSKSWMRTLLYTTMTVAARRTMRRPAKEPSLAAPGSQLVISYAAMRESVYCYKEGSLWGQPAGRIDRITSTGNDLDDCKLRCLQYSQTL
jgi:hypothetical protein